MTFLDKLRQEQTETFSAAQAVIDKAAEEEREDAPLNGRITVSVDINDDTLAEHVRAAFAEFGASKVDEK